MKTLLTRALTGLIFIAVIVGAICAHAYTFFLLFVLIVGLALWEFYGFVPNNNKSIQKITGIAGGMYLYAASFFYAGGYAPSSIFLPYILFLLLFLIDGLYHKTSNPVNDWAITLFAQFYCAGLFSFLNFIAFDQVHTYNPHYILLIFVFVWLNDTGAYLAGTTFGKQGRHRLFPRISPLKSWEGFWGGFVIVLSASLFLAWLYPGDLRWYDFIALAVIIVVFSTWGDLIESLIKRTYGIKDSGKILPGHGGILDRFDSILFVLPAVFLYLIFFIRS